MLAKRLAQLEYPTKGYKYLGSVTMVIILKEVLLFLVFYTPQGGTELSDRVSGVRY